MQRGGHPHRLFQRHLRQQGEKPASHRVELAARPVVLAPPPVRRGCRRQTRCTTPSPPTPRSTQPGCNSPTLIAPAQSEQRYAIGVPSGTVSIDGKLTEYGCQAAINPTGGNNSAAFRPVADGQNLYLAADINDSVAARRGQVQSDPCGNSRQEHEQGCMYRT